MSNTLLIRRKRRMFRVPAAIWKRNVQWDARRVTARLEFMGTDHHLIRNFVVIELAKTQQPLSAESIAESLGLEPKR